VTSIAADLCVRYLGNSVLFSGGYSIDMTIGNQLPVGMRKWTIRCCA